MLIIGTFEHSIELEQALTVLEQKGISKKSILVVPMDSDPKTYMQFTGKSQNRFYKAIEVGMACATASCVIGTAIGFSLTWGPVFWALIGAAAGFAIGFGLYTIAHKGNYRNLPKVLPEVTVIVRCQEEMSSRVMETMWRYNVLTVGIIKEYGSNNTAFPAGAAE